MGVFEMITAIAVIAIVFEFVTKVIKMGLKHAENLERIKHGYPTIEQEKHTGFEKMRMRHADSPERRDYVDMTDGAAIRPAKKGFEN